MPRRGAPPNQLVIQWNEIRGRKCMAERTEIRSLTGLRGLAALYVMIYHYSAGVVPSHGVINNLRAHGYLSVDLFFALSGFVMAMMYAGEFLERTTWRSYFSFLGRRVARVYPLYALATLVAAALGALGWLEYHSQKLAVDLPLNLLMVQSWFSRESLDMPAWSISAEWAAYLSFPVLVLLTFSRSKWVTGLTVIVALVTVPYALPADRLMSLGVPLARCLSAFVLGLFAYRLTLVPRVSALRDLPWLEPVVTVVFLGLLGTTSAEAATVFFSPVLIFFLSADRWSVSRLLRTRLVHRLGVLSFSIYLIHNLLPGLMEKVHRAVNNRGMAHGQVAAALVAVPLTLVMAEFACRWVEMPARKAVRHLIGRTSAHLGLGPAAANSRN